MYKKYNKLEILSHDFNRKIRVKQRSRYNSPNGPSLSDSVVGLGIKGQYYFYLLIISM